MYDEIARSPLIISGPGCAKAKVYPHTVSHIDLPATVLDYMTGLPMREATRVKGTS